MPDYIPPTIEVETRINTARPDGRNWIDNSASLEIEGVGIEAGYGVYHNPNVSVSRLVLEPLPNSSDVDLALGAHLVESDLVPYVRIGTALIDGDDVSINSSFERGLYDGDPRSIDELIQHNTISMNLWSEAVNGWGKVAFISDGGEVFEGGVSVPLDENGAVSFEGYGRAATEDTGRYWAPGPFVSGGIRYAVPFRLSDELTGGVGAQVAVSHDDGFSIGVPAGVQLNYNGEGFKASAELGYGYGLTAGVKLEWSF